MTRAAHIGLVLAVALGTCWGELSVWADDREEALRLVDQGDALLRKGQPADALEKYQQAYSTMRSPKLYYPIAKAEVELGRYLDALAHFQQILVEVEPGSAKDELLLADSEAQIEQIKAKIGMLSLDVSPEGASVTVDGVELGNAPLADAVPLLPGEHTYRVSKTGYTSVQGKTVLGAGKTAEVSVVLKKGVVGPPANVVKLRSRRRIMLGGIVGTSVLALSGTITGVLAIKKHGDYTNMSLTVDEREAARRAGASLALTTDVLFLASAASLAFTTYWYLRKVRPLSERSEPTERASSAAGNDSVGAQSAWLPYVSGDGGGLMWTGRF